MKRIYLPGNAASFPNYERAIQAAGGQACFGCNPENCDALLLPGGGDLMPCYYGQKNTASSTLDPERDRIELEVLERFVTLEKPILGICRGMQLINVFFGGTLLQDISGHNNVDGIDRLHKIRTAASPLEPLCGQTCIVNSSHHQAIDRLGSKLTAVQWAPDGIIEAVLHDALPVYGVQWHPERMDNPLKSALFTWFFNLCT